MDFSIKEQSILRTVAHFDVLDYPLTLLELENFNGLGLPLAEIFEALNHEPLNRFISQRQGLYCLQGRDSIVFKRLNRYRQALLKLERAKKFAALFGVFPWIRGAAVYSSLSLMNSSADGDIDFFFITAKNRAWSARFFLTAFLKIFRLRPTPDDPRDQICASYWVDESNLDLSRFNYEADHYYYYGCASFIFLSAEDRINDRFWNDSAWIKKFLPSWRPQDSGNIFRPNAFWRLAQSIKEALLGLIPESIYRDFQMKIMPQKYLAANDGKKVSLEAGIIKLHDNDKRADFNRLFENNYEGLLQ